MKVGDVVKLNKHIMEKRNFSEKIGVIVDALERDDGFSHFEVVFGQHREWFNDLELEVVSESR